METDSETDLRFICIKRKVVKTMSERLHLCVYKYAINPVVVSEELNEEVYKLTGSSIDDFQPGDEELLRALERIDDDEARSLLSTLKSDDVRWSDLCQFEFY